MTSQNSDPTAHDELQRPIMVNGFWPEAERPQAQAAAEELRRLGLSEDQVSFSRTGTNPQPETDSGGVLDWMRNKLSATDAEEGQTMETEPVVLRSWPSKDMAEQVAEVMRRHGAEKVNHWSSGDIREAERPSVEGFGSSSGG